MQTSVGFEEDVAPSGFEADAPQGFQPDDMSKSQKDNDQPRFYSEGVPSNSTYLRNYSLDPKAKQSGPGERLERVMHGIGVGASAVGNELLDPVHGWPNQLLHAMGREGWDTDAKDNVFGKDEPQAKYPPLFEAGKPILPKLGFANEDIDPVNKVLGDALRGMTTPEMVATLPATMGEGVVAKILQGGFLGQTAPAAIENISTALDSSVPTQQRKEAGVSAGLNTLFSALLGHGLVHSSGSPGVSIPEVLPPEAFQPQASRPQYRLDSPAIDVESERLSPEAYDASSQALGRKMIAGEIDDSGQKSESHISEGKVDVHGGGESSLIPEQRATSRANNSPAAWEDFRTQLEANKPITEAGETAADLNKQLEDDQPHQKTYGGLPFLDPDFWKSQLGIGSHVRVDSAQLYNRIRNKLGDKSVAWEMLDSEDFKGFMQGKRTPEEVAKWVEDNGPKVEVHSYGMEGKVSETQQKADLMRHEWFDNLDVNVQNSVDRAMREGGDGGRINNADYNSWIEQAVDDYQGNKQEFRSKLAEYDKLIEQIRNANDDTSSGPRATSAYTSVSPKDVNKFPVERVDVTIPQKQLTYENWLIRNGLTDNPEWHKKFISGEWEKAGIKNTEPELWTQDNLHENLPNTLGWAALQYEPHPTVEGGKVAHVFEAQSRWGQEARTGLRFDDEGIPWNEQASSKGKGKDIQHPLLRDYNRLILKAAIERAREQGATHIAVSDAETAMMSEGHDKYARERTLQDPMGDPEEKVIEQEPGMRLNYDTLLPRILEELTGAKGEKVSLGEHKNAFAGANDANPNYEHVPRKDLIFRNPDGTPKTDVTAHVYPLEGVRKQFTMTGKDKAETKAKEGGTKLYGGIPFLDPDFWKGEYDKWKEFIKSGVPKERISQLLDAADNKARIGGRQYGNRIRTALRDKLDRQALTFVIEAGDDKSILRAFRTQVASNPTAVAAINHAMTNWNSLKPHADAASLVMEGQRTRENSVGINTDQVENYIKHAYDMPRGILFNGGKGGSGVGASFKKQRTYANYASAIEQGLKPQTLDAADLIESRLAAGGKMVNRAEWGKTLGTLKDPSSGNPISTALIRQPKGTEVAPKGYSPREILPGVRVAVLDGYTGLFDALTGHSVVTNSVVGRALLNTEGFVKHGLLLFDTFHASRMLQKKAFLTGKPTFNKGYSLLEYDLPTIRRLASMGQITPKIATWLINNKPVADLLIKNGINVGRITDALYAGVVRKELKVLGVDINVPGRFNRWVFDKVTRGAMLEAGLTEFARVRKQNPNWSYDQVAGHVAKQINVFFGNLGRQGLFKSASMRDGLQLAFLAPQWVEGMVQTEARAYKQAAQIPADAVRGKMPRVGTALKGTATGILAYVIATQLLNLYFRGQSTFDNKEKEHKLDAWIPDPTGKTPGFWLSPLSVAAEVTHDVIRERGKGKNYLDVVAQILGNKFSPLARGIETARTGRDFAGNKVLGVGERLKQTGKSMVPLPLPAAGWLSDTPGANVRQGFGSLGLKMEPANQREEDTARLSGMSLSDRAKAQQELNKDKEVLPIQQRYAIAQRATDRMFEREESLTSKLSDANQQWITNSKLQLRGYDPEFTVAKTKLKLSSDEADKLEDYVANRYNERLDYLRTQSGVVQKRLDQNLEVARMNAINDFKRQYRASH